MENFKVTKNSNSRTSFNMATNSCLSFCFFTLLLFVSYPLPITSKQIIRADDPCQDKNGNAQQCRPDFQNIALNKAVRVSETCGTPESERFCRLIIHEGRVERVCEVCEASGVKSHPASFLTDINDMGNITYWLSKPFLGRSRRDRVTLLISFGKSHELSYISLQFFSPRPASMIIYKSTNHRRTWQPYQFYARNCRHRFGLENKWFANRTNEQEALCSESYSSPFPASGGRVSFNPTRGRPSEDVFETSHILQDWVTATDIKIVLIGVNDVNGLAPRLGFNKRRSVGAKSTPRSSRRLKGDLPRFEPARNTKKRTRTADKTPREKQKDSLPFTLRKGSRRSAPAKAVYTNTPTSVQQYGFGVSPFYAINDIAIGGRCKCNGHASTCSMKNGRLACDCRHNTDGTNCEKCKRFHYDKPWKRATPDNPNECVGELLLSFIQFTFVF